LREVRTWLDRPENRNEFLMIYLENNLDGDRTAHDIVAREIADVFGPLVARPPASSPCAPLPLDSSRAAMRAAGHRVLFVGNCGPGAWGSWVFERGPQWDETGSGFGNDFPAFPACRTGSFGDRMATHFMRDYEDSTWLSAMTGGGGELTLTEAQRMVRCGVNWIGFDQLRPSDPRLAALIWSWAPGQPAAGSTNQCARSDGDTHLRAVGCDDSHVFACVDSSGAWHVTAATGPWTAGPAACAAEFVGSHFAAPPNGYRNGLMRSVAGSASVWVAAHQDGAVWVA
jgi:hypothetical protein